MTSEREFSKIPKWEKDFDKRFNEDESFVEAFESLSNLKQVEATQQRLPSMWKNLHNSIIKRKD